MLPAVGASPVGACCCGEAGAADFPFGPGGACLSDAAAAAGARGGAGGTGPAAVVLRGVSPAGVSVVIVDDAGSAWADGAVEVDDVGGVGAGCGRGRRRR